MAHLRNLSRLLLLALAAAPAAACSSSQTSEEDGDDSALVNGTTSGASDDSVVAVFRRDQPWCAATVVGQNVLLTALHCVTDIDNSGAELTVGAPVQPNELSIHMGTKPAVAKAATVSRIVLPDGAKAGSPLKSNDIALLFVQPIDPAFAKLRPVTLSPRSVVGDQYVNVVGYTQVAVDPFGVFTSLERQRRDDVYVWAGAAEHPLVRADLDDGQSFYWRNRGAEFTTETVACGSDSGGPAFDVQGNLVGIVSGVVGECVGGSLSVFSDVASHADFIKKATQSAGQLCLTDSQCGPATSGRICDGKTNRCILGCRSGSNSCAGGATCSAQGQAPGTMGICRTTSSPNDPSDPGYNNGPYTAPSGATCPGDPLCPTAPGARECQVDTDCNGQAGTKPRVCDIPRGRCLDGCRVGAQQSMCATNQSCGASHDDPMIGSCQVSQTPTPPANQPPASPPTMQPDSVPPSTTPDTIASNSTAGGDAGKSKKKNGAKAGDSGCSIGATHAPTRTSSIATVWALALGALAFRRRTASRKQSA